MNVPFYGHVRQYRNIQNEIDSNMREVLDIVRTGALREEITETVRSYTRQRYVAGTIVVLMILSVVYFGIQQDRFQLLRKKPPVALLPQPTSPPPPPVEAPIGGRISEDTQEVGIALYTQAALPFEIASVLLLVAIIGSVVLARTRRQEETFD